MVEKKVETKEEEGQTLVKFRETLYKGDFDEAKRIEREVLMPPHLTKPVVNTVFDLFINEKRYSEAIEIAKKYDFSMDRIADVVAMEFRDLVAKRKFEDAIDWGMKNGLTGKDLTIAAIKWVEHAIKSGDVKTAILVKDKYSVNKESIGNLWMDGFSEASEKKDFSVLHY